MKGLALRPRPWQSTQQHALINSATTLNAPGARHVVLAHQRGIIPVGLLRASGAWTYRFHGVMRDGQGAVGRNSGGTQIESF